MTTATEWAEAWKVAAAMCQWSPDRTAAYADHTWRHASDWAATLTTADLDTALRTLEQQLGQNVNSRPVPGMFTGHLRAQANRHLTSRPNHVDTSPPTDADRTRTTRGAALCRWAAEQGRAGRPPTLAQAAAKHTDPTLVDVYGRSRDSLDRAIDDLIAGDTHAP